ncbi:MAG TPA: ABC transporter substrate-binding protein [Nitrososphaerales archaeon]|nr:ABC transporter substrate-binding protein [Nitrososphaerales archaeon]
MPNFSVEPLSPNEKILTDAAGRKLLLYNGKEPKSSAARNCDLAVKIPLTRTIACTPIQLAFALRLEKEAGGGVLDKFAGILNAAEAHLVLPELMERMRNGKLRDIRSISELRAAKPDISFAFLWTREDPQLVNILEHLKLPYVVTDAWYESSFLDRIRWMEFIAHFFNLENKAHEIIARISEEIEAIKTLSKRTSTNPKVLWFVDFQDFVYVTGGRSWPAQSVADLGGNVITPEPNSSGSVDSSRDWVADHMSEADVIVFTMVRPTIAHISQLYPKVNETPAFKNKKVFGFSLEYWQESTYAPELWYTELSNILRPTPMVQELRVFVQARM